MAVWSGRGAKRWWLGFGFGLIASLLGAAVLLTPAAEYSVLGIVEKLGLPAGLMANVAFYVVAAVMGVSALGLVVMGMRSVVARGRR